MATHNIAAGAVAKHGILLGAGVADTVTFADNVGQVQIISDGAAAVYYTTDGTEPTVGGDNCYMLPAVPCIEERQLVTAVTDTIKLISSGTPTLSVQRG